LIVSIDKRLIEPRLWKVEEVYVYALSYCCVGISPEEIVEWKIKALHWEKVSCIQTPKSIKLKFPQMLYEFYWLMQPEVDYSLSGHNKMVLMIIERKSQERIYDKRRKLEKQEGVYQFK